MIVNKVIYIAHNNTGAAHILLKLREAFPDFDFTVIITSGLYYNKSYIGSIFNIIVNSSISFAFRRFFDLFITTDKKLKEISKILDFQIIKTKDINSEKILNIINEIKPDLIISTFTMHVLEERIINSSKIATMGVHPSLLPSYRGLEVFFWMLANGESEGGTTTFLMHPKIDFGQILLQEVWPITSGETVQSIYSKLTESCANLLCKTITKINEGSPFPPASNQIISSYFPMPTRECYKKFKKSCHKWR